MGFLGAQGAYPPPSGFQQYPPPYPGSAVENAPPLATKSDDYNRQSAFNPNVGKNKPESLISHFEMMTDGKYYVTSAQSATLVIYFRKSIILKKKGNTYMTCIIQNRTCTVRIHYTLLFYQIEP